MALRIRYVAIFLLAFCLVAILLSPPARSHHQEYLPLVPATPIMKSIKATQEYTWCVNQRAAQYPQFTAQVREVSDAYTRLVGIKNRQVEYGSSCQVRHDMRDDHPCGGCAAWVFYANNPVTIEYKATVGYTLWQTTIGHELGHALLGLHEQYTDLGSIQCTGKQTTVMDCGSGVKYPTVRDIGLGCAMYQTSWCGQAPAPPKCAGPVQPNGLYWDDCQQRWVNGAGWTYSPATGIWYLPNGNAEWGACASDWAGRWNFYREVWMPVNHQMYAPERGFWSVAPPC